MNAPADFTGILNASAQDEYVCWTRMQAEAGQSLTAIVERKEVERKAGDGLFLWGVGSAPPLISNILARAQLPVRVVFSVMKSKPKAIDMSPSRTVVWRRFIDAVGIARALPTHCIVTSRADGGSGPKRSHYALMCRSDEPLTLAYGRERFDQLAFRNAGGTGAPIGNSQVTVLAKRITPQAETSDYEVNLTAYLAESYWVRLTDPVVLNPAKLALIASLNSGSASAWSDVAEEVREGAASVHGHGDNYTLL